MKGTYFGLLDLGFFLVKVSTLFNNKVDVEILEQSSLLHTVVRITKFPIVSK